MQDLTGKIAVVTGGAGGIGLALCEELQAEGMHIVVSDVRADAVDAAVAGLRASGRDGQQAIGVVTDVSDPDSVEALAATTFDTFGACHVLCNNAGVGAPSSTPW
jgi:NAD(P)-dependent dehydrogenase (short-subunit alcohol dehydrogenase family)